MSRSDPSFPGQLTVGGNVGEALQLTPLPLAVADVEVDVNGGSEALRPVRRDFNQQRVLQHKAFPVPVRKLDFLNQQPRKTFHRSD